MEFKLEDILLNISGKTQKDIFSNIANSLIELKISTKKNKSIIEKAFKAREDQSTTGFEQGIAIPHIMIAEVKKPTILFIKLKNEVEWNSLDNKPVSMVFAIAMPNNSGDKHLKSIADISKLLVNKDFIIKLKGLRTKKSIQKLLNESLAPKKTEKNIVKTIKTNNKTIKVAAITSCPTGIAHTHMAAEALELYGKENNIQIKVERQAAQGTESQLTKMDIDNADYILICTGRPIDGKSRFGGKMVYQTGVAAPLKNAKKVFDDMKSQAKLMKVATNQAKGGLNFSDTTTIGKVTPMQALLNGLSHMIPFVIVGGLFLAVALGVNKGIAPPAHTFWSAILNIGAAGFSLMVVILGGYIAFAIGGRATLAPAMILTYIANGAAFTGSYNPFFFDYQKFNFGVGGANAPANLGFFGAIAIGLIVGYAIKYWNMHVSTRMPRSLRSVEPILITPILFTLVGWLMISFVLYLPLYYLSLGFKDGVNKLVSLNLLWIAGIVLGGMMAFDMGGPINKIAFGLGVLSIKQDNGLIMGAVAAAGSVPPIGSALGYLFGRHILRVKSFNNEIDQQSCLSGLVMGFCGITEGAIPYAVRHPKSAILANVMGGAVASGIAAAFAITCIAPHTGPIVYLVNAVGHVVNGNALSSYSYGLFYLMAMGIGIAVTALMFPILTKAFEKKSGNKESVLSNIKLFKSNKNTATKKMVPEKK